MLFADQKIGRGNLITPAFIEARHRKLKNDCTNGRLFPLESRSVERTHLIKVRKSLNAGVARHDSYSGSPIFPRAYSNLSDFSRISAASHSSSGSLDSSLPYQHEYRGLMSRTTTTSVPLDRNPSTNRRPPSIAYRETVDRNKLSEAMSRRTSRAFHGSIGNEQQQKINQWFSSATQKEKDIALNLLSAISPNLCPKEYQNCCSPNTTRYSQRLSINSKETERSATRVSGTLKERSYLYHPDNAVVNHAALAYFTPQHLPLDFVIHPEWTEPTRNVHPLKRQVTNEIMIEPQYGYWRK